MALAPTCAGCHVTGNKPYFASLSAFENGLVYDTKWVNPADPERSGLLLLLQGKASGSYPQMPPGQPYAGGPSLATLTEWIRDLPPRGAINDTPSPEAFTVRRLRAEEMILALQAQLGLSPADFVDTSRPTWRDEEWTVHWNRLFVWPTDWAPGISGQYVSDKRSIERYETLGGAVALQGRKKDLVLGPSSMQTLVQMSQAWCKFAIEKPGNKAVLRYATLTDTSAKNAATIQKNIAHLWLSMLGDLPTEAEVSELYQQVYVPFEPSSTTTAWTGVCAALVRHPKWLSY